MFDNNLTRRYFHTCLGAIFAGLLSTSAKSAPSRQIPVSKSLPSEISTALKAGLPLLVFVSLDGCPYCKIALENYLLPLINEQSIPMVQVNFRHLAPVIDARGNVMTQDQLVRAWAVKVAPTLLFLGKEGKETAPRLVGGSTSDFYGAYLNERLEQAIKAIK